MNQILNYDLKTLYEIKEAAESQLTRFVDGVDTMSIDEMNALENEIMELDEKIANLTSP